MLITEMIAQLEEAKKEHGDLPIQLSNRYTHYDVKWVAVSPHDEDKHFCIRIDDAHIRYD